MFTNKNKPSMNELIVWFMKNYTNLVDDMQKATHAVRTDEPNPYHSGDNSIFTHTMLVCQRAEIASEEKYNKINLITALLHDIGKPESREVIPFEAKKPTFSESNEIRNSGKFDGKDSGLNRKVPKSGLKCHFRGHESISFFLAIDVVNKLEEIGVISRDEKIQILTIISMHGTLFDNITEDGEMRKPYKVFNKFPKSVEGMELFNDFVLQVRNDSLGRFFTSKDGRKNNAYKLGSEIFTGGQFSSYCLEQGYPDIAKKNENAPTITVLTGLPGSGKSTWLEANIKDEVVISRDDTLMEYAEDNDIKGNYSEVWKKLTDDDQLEVDKLLQVKFRKAVKQKQNIIVDMTCLSRKSRRKWLTNVSKDYNKKAVVFATTLKETYRRLDKRKQETEKSIPLGVIKSMSKTFMVPTYDEVQEITWVF